MPRPSNSVGLSVLVAASIVSFLYLQIAHRDTTTLTWPVDDPAPDARYLLDLKLTDPFEYRRQCIRPLQSEKLVREQSSVFHVDSELVQDPETYTIHRRWVDELESMEGISCQQPLILDVPAPIIDETDHDMLMLGAATTLPRLLNAIPEWAPYLGGSGVKIAALLRDQTDPASKDLKPAMDLAHEMGVNLKIICQAELLPTSPEGMAWPELGEAQSNVELSLAFMKYGHPHTQWFGVVDDDTFINSMPDLLHALSQYDSSEPYWLGAQTENNIQLYHEESIAFGGAGIFLSRPLLESLVLKFSDCFKIESKFGDLLWARCINALTPTNLTILEGLHQLDYHGDMTGWYESGIWPMLTLHHWRSFHEAPVPKVHKVTEVAGTDSFLARFRFWDDTVLTNGYSIVKYPNGVPDLGQGEITWEVAKTDPKLVEKMWNHPGPLRPPLPKDEKQSWLLEQATFEDGQVRQFYVKRGAVDSVIELDWAFPL